MVRIGDFSLTTCAVLGPPCQCQHLYVFVALLKEPTWLKVDEGTSCQAHKELRSGSALAPPDPRSFERRFDSCGWAPRTSEGMTGPTKPFPNTDSTENKEVLVLGARAALVIRTSR